MTFSNQLIHWYKKNKRDLPWRKSKDPYVIWLSEIILQQTKVDQGLSYFNRFLEEYPSVDVLAQAQEIDVLKLWQGLGYYSRARNLHYTAKYIVKEYNGIFPNNYEDILRLKGVGEYTAAAISSFSFDLVHPVIDGNVFRVLSRFFGVDAPIDSSSGKKAFKVLANSLIDKENPATYNQAIMEFGALQCKPKNPNCEICPLLLECFAFKNNAITDFPKKEKKLKQRNRYFNYLVIINDNKTYIKERVGNDIWKGLFDFPLIETEDRVTSIGELNTFLKKNTLFDTISLSLKVRSNEFKHILSHQKIWATFWVLETNKIEASQIDSIEVLREEINNYPIPKLIDNYLYSIS